MEKQKKENLYMGVKWTKLYSLGVKLNQVIIYGLFRLWLYLKGYIELFPIGHVITLHYNTITLRGVRAAKRT